MSKIVQIGLNETPLKSGVQVEAIKRRVQVEAQKSLGLHETLHFSLYMSLIEELLTFTIASIGSARPQSQQMWLIGEKRKGWKNFKQPLLLPSAP
uniref:Uncharacterized protein n=1 Tax=Cannabis sativa TaxID=3483 RepID=A0A803QGZ8_CANSA